MRLLIAIFTLLLTLPARATMEDAGTLVGTSGRVLATNDAGVVTAAGQLRVYKQNGDIDSVVCVAPENNSAPFDGLCVDSSGNVTASGTISGSSSIPDPWTVPDGEWDVTGAIDLSSTMTASHFNVGDGAVDSPFINFEPTTGSDAYIQWTQSLPWLGTPGFYFGNSTLFTYGAGYFYSLNVAGGGYVWVWNSAYNRYGLLGHDGSDFWITSSYGNVRIDAPLVVSNTTEHLNTVAFDSSFTLGTGTLFNNPSGDGWFRITNAAGTAGLLVDVAETSPARVILYNYDGGSYAYLKFGGAYLYGQLFVDYAANFYGGVLLGDGTAATECIDADTTGTDPGNGVCWDGTNNRWNIDADIYATGKTVTATTFTGNAGSATELASDPSDCDANKYANAIAKSGNLTCAQPDHGNLAGLSDYADHAGYTLIDGTRAFTGNQSHGDYNITDVGDVKADSVTGEATTLTLATTSNGNLILQPNGTGDTVVYADSNRAVCIGDGTCSSGHSAYVVVEPVAEFDGAFYADSTATFGSTVTHSAAGITATAAGLDVDVGSDLFAVSNGSYSAGHSPMFYAEGIAEVDGAFYADSTSQFGSTVTFSAAGVTASAAGLDINYGSDVITLHDGSIPTWGHSPKFGVEGIAEFDANTYFDGDIYVASAKYIYANSLSAVDTTLGLYGAEHLDIEIVSGGDVDVSSQTSIKTDAYNILGVGDGTYTNTYSSGVIIEPQAEFQDGLYSTGVMTQSLALFNTMLGDGVRLAADSAVDVLVFYTLSDSLAIYFYPGASGVPETFMFYDDYNGGSPIYAAVKVEEVYFDEGTATIDGSGDNALLFESHSVEIGYPVKESMTIDLGTTSNKVVFGTTSGVTTFGWSELTLADVGTLQFANDETITNSTDGTITVNGNLGVSNNIGLGGSASPQIAFDSTSTYDEEIIWDGSSNRRFDLGYGGIFTYGSLTGYHINAMNGGSLYAYNSGGTRYVQIYHDGTDGGIYNSYGALNIGSAVNMSSYYLDVGSLTFSASGPDAVRILCLTSSNEVGYCTDALSGTPPTCTCQLMEV